jgi:hypothetical protein
VSHVHAWVRALLSPAAAALPWFLFTTPPPTALAESGTLSLFDARLAPASLLVLGWGTGPAARSLPAGAVAPATAAELLSPAALAAAVPDFDAPCALEASAGTAAAAPSVGGTASSSSSAAAVAGGSGSAFPSSLKLVSEAEAALSSMNLDAMADSLMGRPAAAGGAPPAAAGGAPAAAAAARGGASADATGGSRVARSGLVPSWLKINK